MPYDLLIVQIESIVAFLVEYLDTTDISGFNLIYVNLKELLEKNFEIKNLFKNNFEEFSFDKKQPQSTQRNMVIYFVKIKIIKLLKNISQRLISGHTWYN
jgi:hypothetical protein